jgi:hypothetical protein
VKCRIIVLSSIALSASAEERPPAPLVCMVRYYEVKAEHDAAGWWARLPGGARIPYDDRKTKSFEQKLESPDVEDAFSIPYRKGAIRPVETPDDDPGRIRVDPIFEATYPTRDSDMTAIDFLGQRLRVHKKVAAAFRRVESRLRTAEKADPAISPFLVHLGGTFVKRNIAGTDRKSAHSYGVSIDLNAERSEYWRWQRPRSPIRWRNHVPQSIVEAFEAEGFIWGGRWYHYDTMHFEYRPELLDERCSP